MTGNRIVSISFNFDNIIKQFCGLTTSVLIFLSGEHNLIEFTR